MKMKQFLSGLIGGVAAIALVAGLAGSIQASVIVENFDYGDTIEDLNTLGSAGDGWSGGWSGSGNPEHTPGVNLSYIASGYVNDPANTDTGAAVNGGGNASADVNRSFTGTLSGTIWVSALSFYTTTNADALLWLRGANSGANFISLRSRAAALRVEGGNSTTGSFVEDSVHLLLARVTINGGGNDEIAFWVDPDLSSGEAGLGLPTLVDTGDIGNLTGIGVSFGGSGALDQIRISNAANGFQLVTALIPEPTSLALLSLGGLMILRRRRRAA